LFGQPSSDGSPRIMLSMSTDGGWSWTPRKAFDAGPRTEHALQQGVGQIITRPSGPQIQPQLSISGTASPQLLSLFYEAREELAQPYAINFISGIERLFEVRVARINPSTGQLLAPSAQVSEYPLKPNSSPAALAETAPGFRKGNYGNETTYSGGLRAFLGDYPVIVPTMLFEKGPNWKYATEPSPSVTMFTDNRDIEFPKVNGQPNINGDWTTYQPVNKLPPNCDHVALRNANPYFSAIGGVFAGSPQTFKPLNIQRAFVVYVKNRTPQDRFFRLTIQDNEAADVDGSFDQFLFDPGQESIDVMTFANSSQTRTLWVNPAPNPTASVRVLVQEISGMGGALVGGGYSARVILNPDDNNNPIISVPPSVPGFEDATFDQNELHNPQLGSPQQGSPQISSFHIKTPQQGSPQISTPQQGSLGMPQISTSNETTPQLGSPQLGSPQLGSIPDGEQNGTDVTFTVTNIGNTNSQYEALFNVQDVVNLIGSGNYQFQVIISRTTFAPGFTNQNGPCEPAAVAKTEVVANIPIPQLGSPQISTINNPQLGSPQQGSPQISTFSVGPENGPEGQNSHGDEGNEDAHSTVLPDIVHLTVRAIRLRPLAAGGPTFNPATVQAKVTAGSTNVIDGVVQEEGTEPEAFSDPDLVVANYTPASPALETTPGGQVTLSSWSMRNQGGPIILIEGEIQFGYYLSTDAVITAEDLLLGSGGTGGLGSGQQVNFTAPTLTIPAGVAPGQYFIGIFVDRTNFIDESNEGNNFVSEPIEILVAAPPQFVVTTNADSGPGSLRQAILDSNENDGTDTIVFEIDGPGLIMLQTPLPGLDAVVIDATPNGACADGVPPSVQIDGSLAGETHGLFISEGDTTIRGLSITNFGAGSGVWAGIFIAGGGGSVIECNYLGLAPNGSVAGNGIGLKISGASSNRVGADVSAARNLISGNTGNGIELQQAHANQVWGNYIGTDSTAELNRANGGNGIQLIEGLKNSIGGTAPGHRNVVAFNAAEGIRLDGGGATGNLIAGNSVSNNGASGIYLRRAPGNSVLNNFVVSNDGFAGIAICGNLEFCGGIPDPPAATLSNAAGNSLLGNTSQQNEGYGVSIDSAPGTFVGGAAQGNVITLNGAAGVVVFGSDDAVDNLIQRNSISANGGLGIDLVADGVTANDGGDADNGPNNLQNFPVLEGAGVEGSSVTIAGSFNSSNQQTFTLDFYVSPSCDSSGNGEGAVYIGSSPVTTNADGNVDFNESFDFPVGAGNQFTATATDSDGNTSEFSNCVGVGVP
jgi:parallel beta-helix repeat protein